MVVMPDQIAIAYNTENKKTNHRQHQLQASQGASNSETSKNQESNDKNIFDSLSRNKERKVEIQLQPPGPPVLASSNANDGKDGKQEVKRAKRTRKI